MAWAALKNPRQDCSLPRRPPVLFRSPNLSPRKSRLKSMDALDLDKLSTNLARYHTLLSKITTVSQLTKLQSAIENEQSSTRANWTRSCNHLTQTPTKPCGRWSSTGRGSLKPCRSYTTRSSPLRNQSNWLYRSPPGSGLWTANASSSPGSYSSSHMSPL